MWQKVNHPLFGNGIWAWVYQGGTPSWTVGKLQNSQVWAQFSDDGPYHPAEIATSTT